MASIKLAKLGNKPEIFHTLQGEGVSMGLPSVFVRSTLCNLHCTWCDTAYTWNWEGTKWNHEDDEKYSKSDYIVELETTEVASLVADYGCLNVVLTGGEPLLQQQAWLAIIEDLRKRDSGYRFEIETNGTQLPDEHMAAAVDQWNVSTKLSNSGNSAKQRIKNEAMQFFSESDKAWFKFVIQNEQDLAEVIELEAQFGITKERILLMPEGRDEATLQNRRLWLADLCRDQGYRFSDRLHIQLWGSKRGV